MSNFKHGYGKNGKKSAEYKSWASMRSRCLCPSAKGYKDYGGRGILICERWNSFENFLADMGKRPERKSLDRYPNTNGNYEPGNCRWATRQQQNSNRRDIPNSSGFRGVGKVGNKFRAYIYFHGFQRYIGTFPTAKLASLAYEAAREVLETSRC